VVGGHRLDTEHDLDLVAGVEGGEGEEGAVHAPVLPAAGFGWVEREGAEHGSDGFAHEAWVDGAGLVEDGGSVVLVGWGGLCVGMGHSEFVLCSKCWLRWGRLVVGSRGSVVFLAVC
jgi:hypothetical protein